MSDKKWQIYTVARVRNDVPANLVAEAFNPKFKRFLGRPCVVAWVERAEAFLTTYPELGREMALRAPELIQRACRERGLCDLELEVRAWTVRGCMLRVLGRLSEAETAFSRAVALEDRFESTSPEFAWTWANYGILKTMQGHHTKALDLTDAAVNLLLSSSDPRIGTCDRLSLPCALVMRGTVLGLSDAPIEEETRCFLEALRLATKSTPVSKKTAANNLTARFVKGLMKGEPLDLDALLQWCASLHRRLAKQRERVTSPARCRLRWLEAQALSWRSGGLTPQAEAYFATARNSLLKHGATQVVVLLNLDLGYWLSQDRQWQKLEKLAEETAQLARAADYKTEALVALQQWREALENKSGELAAFREAYRVVRGLRAPGLSPPKPTRSSRWISDTGW